MSRKSITGGGRAPLSKDSLNEICDLLYCLKFDKSLEGESANRKDSRRRHFMKSLCKEGGSSGSSLAGAKGENSRGANLHSSSVVVNNTSARVRCSIAQAKFDSSGANFKPGSLKKAQVFSVSMSAKEFLAKCKAKLNMKGKPVCCFVFRGDSKDAGDLRHACMLNAQEPLRGVLDDETVFVSCDVVNLSLDGSSDTDEVKSDDCEAAPTQLPLQACKAMYKTITRSPPPHPPPSVPPAAPSRLNDKPPKPPPSSPLLLPASHYRERIISSVEANQVVVLSGETGCGKSTQGERLALPRLV